MPTSSSPTSRRTCASTSRLWRMGHCRPRGYPRTVAGGIAMIRGLGEVVGVPAAAGPGDSPTPSKARPAAETRARPAGRVPPARLLPDLAQPLHDPGRETRTCTTCSPPSGGANVARGHDGRYPQGQLAEVAAAAPEVILLPDEPYRFRRVHAADFEPYPALRRSAATRSRGRQALLVVRPPHRRGAGDPPGFLAPADAPAAGRYSTSKIISISTGSRGQLAMPTAERASASLFADTSTMRSRSRVDLVYR